MRERMPKTGQRRITPDGLAAMTARGFSDMEGRLTERMDRGFGELAAAIVQLTKTVEEGFRHVNARLDLIEQDVSDLPAIREELQELRQRVELLEKKVGVTK